MCNPAGIQFGKANLSRDEIAGKCVLEVGSTDVNGSLRPWIESLQPAKYWGVDIAVGNGVDEVCDVTDLVSRYGEESFDVVIATELFEHVRDWRHAVSNLKHVLKPNGVLLFTTRSIGFPYHGYPFDFWRYEVDDMAAILRDMRVDKNEKDPSMPGVFVKARKPVPFQEADLGEWQLHSIITHQRCKNIRECDLALFKMRRILARLLPSPLKNFLKKFLPADRV